MAAPRLNLLFVALPYILLTSLWLTLPSPCRHAKTGPASGLSGSPRGAGDRDGNSSSFEPARAQLPLWQRGMLNPLHLWLARYKTGPTWQQRDIMLDIFHQHLHRFRGQPVTVVELGLRGGGGSLAMWRDYLGPRAVILGVDGDKKFKQLEQLIPSVTIMVGDRADRSFLRHLAQRTGGRIDVLVDNGVGEAAGQVAVFEELYPSVTPDGGVYICDGLHASYWPEFGGGLRKGSTFVEYLKGLVDKLNGFHTLHYKILFGKPLQGGPPGRPAADVAAFARSTNNVHFYDGAVVIEKRLREGLPMAVASS